MTQHLHLALQQLTLWFICQLLLLVPPAVPHLYILYVAPWVEITIPLLLFSLWSTHILVSSPDSLMQPKTWLNPVSKLCPTNTHTCTRPSYCWFTVTHNSSTTCWKVGWRSVMLYTAPGCIIGCLTVAFCVCLWILIKEKGRSETPCETQMSQRVWHRGTLIGPRIPPKRHPT